MVCAVLVSSRQLLGDPPSLFMESNTFMTPKKQKLVDDFETNLLIKLWAKLDLELNFGSIDIAKYYEIKNFLDTVHGICYDTRFELNKQNKIEFQRPIIQHISVSEAIDYYTQFDIVLPVPCVFEVQKTSTGTYARCISTLGDAKIWRHRVYNKHLDKSITTDFSIETFRNLEDFIEKFNPDEHNYGYQMSGPMADMVINHT
jgi:hypothetical protein